MAPILTRLGLGGGGNSFGFGRRRSVDIQLPSQILTMTTSTGPNYNSNLVAGNGGTIIDVSGGTFGSNKDAAPDTGYTHVGGSSTLLTFTPSGGIPATRCRWRADVDTDYFDARGVRVNSTSYQYTSGRLQWWNFDAAVQAYSNTFIYGQGGSMPAGGDPNRGAYLGNCIEIDGIRLQNNAPYRTVTLISSTNMAQFTRGCTVSDGTNNAKVWSVNTGTYQLVVISSTGFTSGSIVTFVSSPSYSS
jgi:hypothetical protein